MPGVEQTYNHIVAYLKGLLSDRQRHELEKDLMRDAFEEEAFEGLSQLSAGELEKDIEVLKNRLENRIAPVRSRNLKVYLRLAAGIILFVGVGSILYFIFRTPSSGLLTQDVPGKPAVSNTPVSSSAPVLADTFHKDLKPEKKVTGTGPENPPILAENRTGTKKAMAAANLSSKSTAQGGIFTATVIDSEGKALQGINVVEKGTNMSTTTDKNGRFSLPLTDTGSILSLHYKGFKPEEFHAGENPGEKITMQDDLLAMDEVVVVGFENKKKENIPAEVSNVRTDDRANTVPVVEQTMQGRVAGVRVTQKADQEADELSLKDEAELYNLIRPIPPGGTLKDFKKWVTDQLDQTVFKPYPGKQKILVSFTILANGTISDIRIRDTVPASIAGEFRKVIARSPRWNPALRDNIPVEAQVSIRFIITVE
jgi:hypothetical protein